MDEAQRDRLVGLTRERGQETGTALLARALTVRENWEHAGAELEEGAVSPGPNDGQWNGWHILNHVGGFTQRASEHMRSLAAVEPVALSPGEHWLGDSVSFGEVRTGAIQGWDALVASITEATIAPPGEGPKARHPAFGALSIWEFVAFTLLHAQNHAIRCGSGGGWRRGKIRAARRGTWAVAGRLCTESSR